MPVRALMVLLAIFIAAACESKPVEPAKTTTPPASVKDTQTAPQATADSAGGAAATTPPPAAADTQSASAGGGKINIKVDPSKVPEAFDVSGEKIVIKLKPPVPEAFENPTEDKVGTLPDGIGRAVGTKITPFDGLQDTEGNPIAWSDIIGKAPVLVAFYRGGWCRWCNYQVRRYSQNFDKFKALNLNVVFISVDDIEGGNVTKAAYDVPFPLISDPELQAHNAFNVVFDVDAKELARLESIDIDLTAWSKRKHHKIAIPSLFLIDSSGTVLWAHSEKNFRVRPSLEQVLAGITPKLPKK